MVYPLTPFFLTGVLGAPAWTVGNGGGSGGIVRPACSSSILAGCRIGFGRRKPFAVVGYGLGAVSKLIMALAGGWGQVLGARLVDRTGKRTESGSPRCTDCPELPG